MNTNLNKLTSDTVVVAFGYYEKNLFNQYKAKLAKLNFEERINILEQDNIRFALFKAGEAWSEVDKFMEDYPYIYGFIR